MPWSGGTIRRGGTAPRESSLSPALGVPGAAALALVVACSSGDVRRGSRDTTIPGADTEAVSVHPVNLGAHGAAAIVRWTFSSDSQSMLAVENPAGVENEAVPNGFLFARDDGAFVQRDSVWDVTPSRDWRMLAFSRAYTAQAGAGDSLSRQAWRSLAARVGLPESDVRRGAFRVSGTSPAVGTGRPYLLVVRAGASPDAPVGSIETRALPFANAWRIAFADSGGLLAIGSIDATVRDDAPAARWSWVNPSSGAVVHIGQRSKTSRVAAHWASGPRLDPSIAVDTSLRVLREGGAAEVRSEGGTIRRVERGEGGATQTRRVGPGLALAATRGAHAILALVPAPTPPSSPSRHRSSESRWRLVVYRIVTTR